MNLGVVTTGLKPLTINSIETFQLDPVLDGLPWSLSGGSATLLMTDSAGVSHSYAATIGSDGVARVNWQVIAPVGTWLRAWDCTDSLGRRQVTEPIVFSVASSPS